MSQRDIGAEILEAITDVVEWTHAEADAKARRLDYGTYAFERKQSLHSLISLIAAVIQERDELRAALRRYKNEAESRLLDIANEWRADWTDFDGRVLLSQVEHALKEANAAISDVTSKESADDPR